MKNIFVILSLFGLSSSVNAQAINAADSIAVINNLRKVINSIENSDRIEFLKISKDSLYCLLCWDEEKQNNNVMVSNIDFYNNNGKNILQKEFWKNTNKDWIEKVRLANGFHNSNSDITAYFVFKVDNYPEDILIAFLFKLASGEYKFSGIETIP
jgi:hypothetical protein